MPNHEFEPLSDVLAGWFDCSLDELPDAVRERIASDLWLVLWDELSESQRRKAAAQWDHQHDPAHAEAQELAWMQVCELDKVRREIAEWEMCQPQSITEKAAQADRLQPLRTKERQLLDELNGSGGQSGAQIEIDDAKATPKRGRKASDAPARLKEILDALESYATATGQDFDRYAMPGPLGEDWHQDGSFHWLCAQIAPVFKRAKTTFEKQRAGLCALALYAKPSDFYRLALPHIAPKLGVTLNVHHVPKQGRKRA